MLCIRYFVDNSKIPGAGKGLFTAEKVERGTVIIAPSAIDSTISWEQILAFPEDSIEVNSSVRWFENHYTSSPDWPDDCYVNHSFEPIGLWHLGFIFAARDLEPGEEVTIDYRYLLAPGIAIGFRDALTQREIVGFPWAHHILRSTRDLQAVLSARYGKLEDAPEQR